LGQRGNLRGGGFRLLLGANCLWPRRRAGATWGVKVKLGVWGHRGGFLTFPHSQFATGGPPGFQTAITGGSLRAVPGLGFFSATNGCGEEGIEGPSGGPAHKEVVGHHGPFFFSPSPHPAGWSKQTEPPICHSVFWAPKLAYDHMGGLARLGSRFVTDLSKLLAPWGGPQFVLHDEGRVRVFTTFFRGGKAFLFRVSVG